MSLLLQVPIFEDVEPKRERLNETKPKFEVFLETVEWADGLVSQAVMPHWQLTYEIEHRLDWGVCFGLDSIGAVLEYAE